MLYGCLEINTVLKILTCKCSLFLSNSKQWCLSMDNVKAAFKLIIVCVSYLSFLSECSANCRSWSVFFYKIFNALDKIVNIRTCRTIFYLKSYEMYVLHFAVIEGVSDSLIRPTSTSNHGNIKIYQSFGKRKKKKRINSIPLLQKIFWD